MGEDVGYRFRWEWVGVLGRDLDGEWVGMLGIDLDGSGWGCWILWRISIF